LTRTVFDPGGGDANPECPSVGILRITKPFPCHVVFLDPSIL
jgi:hypothetical protein